MLIWIKHRFKCWKKGLCPVHDTPWSYRIEEYEGPMSGVEACVRDIRTREVRYCKECEGND